MAVVGNNLLWVTTWALPHCGLSPILSLSYILYYSSSNLYSSSSSPWKKRKKNFAVRERRRPRRCVILAQRQSETWMHVPAVLWNVYIHHDDDGCILYVPQQQSEKERKRELKELNWITDGRTEGRMDEWIRLIKHQYDVRWRSRHCRSGGGQCYPPRRETQEQQEFSLGQNRRTSIKSKKRFPPLLMALLYCYYVCCFVIVADDDDHHRHHQSAED